MRSVPACSIVLSVAAAVACGDTKDDGEGGSDSGNATADGSSDGGGDDGVSDGAETGSSGGGSETDGSGDDGGTGSGGASGTEGTTTGDGGTTSTDSSSTTGQGNVEYAAHAVPGGLDRIFIRKADYDRDLCGSLVLVWPFEPPGLFPDVTTPEQWGVEGAAVFQGTTDCLSWDAELPGPSDQADTASGYVDFEVDNQAFYPCSLDLDVSMTFAPVAPEPWIPEELVMAALDLTVEGC